MEMNVKQMVKLWSFMIAPKILVILIMKILTGHLDIQTEKSRLGQKMNILQM